MRNKILAKSLAIFLLCGMLSACTKQKSNSSSGTVSSPSLQSSSATPTPIATPTATPVPTPTPDPDVVTYLNAVQSNGGSVSTNTQAAVNTLVASLKANGVWAKLIEIYPFAGTGISAALTKLKTVSGGTNSITNHNFLSGDYTETGSTGGIKGDASTKYLDTSLSVPGLTRDSISIGVYINVECMVTSAFGVPIGSSYAATGDNDRFYFIGTSSTAGYSGQAGLGNQYVAGRVDGTGFRVMSYDGSSFDTYKGTTAVTVPASAISWQQVGTVTLFNGAGNFYYDGTINFGFVGSALTGTDETNLYNAVQAFETSLSRNL